MRPVIIPLGRNPRKKEKENKNKQHLAGSPYFQPLCEERKVSPDERKARKKPKKAKSPKGGHHRKWTNEERKETYKYLY